jgi:hypothetical protein
MCESGSEISVATVLITCELIPSYPGLFLEFKLFISFSNSYLVIGLYNKEDIFTAINEMFFSRPGPIFTK